LKPRFFKTPSEFRSWLEKNHDSASEIVVGFYKKATGKPTMTWSEAVEQALCFGWIDGVRNRLDEDSYTNRFTPRRPRSNWSAVNIAKVEELTARGLMHPAGLEAFERRTKGPSGVYSYEQRKEARLSTEQERKFRRNKKAWDFFRHEPPSYQTTTIWWVVSAKREETRDRRLAKLIEDSARGIRVGPLRPRTRRS
jgi:uncharacterized protein YdeI (YjbR/CyaY-like superfamily)